MAYQRFVRNASVNVGVYCLQPIAELVAYIEQALKFRINKVGCYQSAVNTDNCSSEEYIH